MSGSLDINIQNPANCQHLPAATIIRAALEAAWESPQTAALTLRVVNKQESQQLNRQFRHKDYPTNILSFPFEAPPVDIDEHYLGDLVACCELILDEAGQQQKNITHHWQHLLIHGILHLQGYDHETEQDASIMEAKEVTILKGLGVTNPYQT